MNIKDLAKKVGARISTTNLMSNPPQKRDYYEFSQKQLDEFVELVLVNRPNEAQLKLDFSINECIDIMQNTSKDALRSNTYMGDDVPTSVHIMNIKRKFGLI